MHALHLLNTLPWPLHGGRQINAHHLMRCLVERGHRVTLLLGERPSEAALAAWPLASRISIQVLDPKAARAGAPGEPGRWMRYWGVDGWVPQAVAAACARLRPDYVEAIGLETPLWLTDLSQDLAGRRLWFAGDAPSLLHRTMVHTAPGLRAKAGEVRRMAAMWAYQRHVGSLVDAAVAVSPADAEALRRTAAFHDVLLTPNGVDRDYFQPTSGQADARTAVFWGRLDFPPNIDAVTGFVRSVWSGVMRRCPGARLRVVGQGATAKVIRACAGDGVHLIGEVPDVRPWIEGGAVTVLPMRSGAGIKNKLLEAAAMARPIVASPRCVAGLTPPVGEPAWRVCDEPRAWIDALVDLWRNPTAGERMGQAARLWVREHHDWTSHAEAREVWLERTGGIAIIPPPLSLHPYESLAA